MGGSIPSNFIREIVETSEIVSLIDSYLPLKKKGNNHWGICPFCDDGSNPSFSVSEQKQFYYCFKCRASGNVISFLQLHQGLDFVESVEALASRAGQEVPYENKKSDTNDRDPVFAILQEASDYYENILAKEASAQSVQGYLKDQRKISGETCRRFSIGYALNSWDSLYKHLTSKGFQKSTMILAGLVKEKKDGGVYDVFRDRLIFPIKDRKGRVVGFGGRVMNPDDQPKYLNTGETPVFHKGKELYGLHESLEDRKNLKDIYVVEGYMDTVAMSENKLNNSVATLGIATNRFHVQKLLQIVNKIIFCFDGDSAGRGAAWSALKNVLPVVGDGVEIKFLFLPEGEDPASLLEKESKEDFNKRSEDSMFLSEYFIQRLSEAIDLNSIEKKALLASKAMDLLSSMPDSSIKKLLEAEVAKVTGLKREDIETYAKPKNYKSKNSQKSNLDRDLDNQEKIFNQSGFGSKALSVLVLHPHLSEEITERNSLRDLFQPEVDLLLEVADFFLANPGSSVTDLFSSIDGDSASFIGTLLSTLPPLKESNARSYLIDCLTLLEKSNSESRIKKLKEVLLNNKLSDEEIFELQQHLLLNLDSLGDEDKLLLKELSKSAINY